MAFLYGKPPSPSIQSQALARGRQVALLALLVLFIGTVGYVLIEGWCFSDSLYMAAITITTVGFGEVHHLHDAGRFFTIFLIFCGVGIWAYTFATFSRLLLEGHFRQFFDRRRSEKMIDTLKDHIIVCGFGRMGQTVSREISEEGSPFVVIEKQESLVTELAERGYLHIIGDATAEDVLVAAGVKRARSLIAVLEGDAANVYAVLSARALNPALNIICRAECQDSENMMSRAGADKVISPYEIGGRTLAQAALRPSVLSFFEMATAMSREDLNIEELLVPPGSPLIGKTLQRSQIRETYGASVIALRGTDRETILNPPPDRLIEEGTVLLVMGRASGLKALSRDLGGPGAP